MTIDQTVARRVDLATVNAGSTVQFILEQGRDKKFRVTVTEPKK